MNHAVYVAGRVVQSQLVVLEVVTAVGTALPATHTSVTAVLQRAENENFK